MNTISRISGRDFTFFKESLNSFMHFYIANANRITDLAEYFGETEDDTVTTILGIGLRGLEERMDLLKKGDDICKDRE